jgi:hypothetical protein
MPASALARRDDVVQDSMGNPISGVVVYCCEQPANTHTVPPTVQQLIYSDSAGTEPIDQVRHPVQTDAYGMAYFYVIPGIYTLVYYSPQIAGLQVVLTDVIISAGTPNSINNDSSANGTIVGLINGVNTEFDLSNVPTPTDSLLLSVNGVVVTGWTISGRTANLPVAPRPGAVIAARYFLPAVG